MIIYSHFFHSVLNKCPIDNFGPSVQTLTGLLLDFVCDHESELPEHGQELCMDLVDVSEKLRIHANRRLGNRKIILNDVSALGQIFSELIDALLMKKIQVNKNNFTFQIWNIFIELIYTVYIFYYTFR